MTFMSATTANKFISSHAGATVEYNNMSKVGGSKGPSKGTRIAPQELQRIQRMYEAGQSAAAIARATGRHYNTITGLRPGTRKAAAYKDIPAAALEDFGLFRSRYLGRVATPWQELAANKIVELLDSDEDEYLIINCPPGVGKSTLMTDTCTWVLARARETRIMYGSASERAASNYTNQVMGNLMRPDLTRAKARDVKYGLAIDGTGNLVDDYGQFKPANGARWTKEKFFIAQDEGRTAQEKDPNMVAFGRDSTFLGGRFDLVIWDDLVTDKTLKTVESREALISWWGSTAETRVEPGGLNCLVGQRLSADDLYRYCIELPSGFDEEAEDTPALEDLLGGDPDATYARKYHHIVFPAHDEEKCKGLHRNQDHLIHSPSWPDGCLLDPRRLSYKKLRMIQVSPNSNYETVYQQKDTDASSALVQHAWVDGGRGKDGIEYIGCKDLDRGLRQAPHGISDAWSVVSVDPSPTRYWSVQWYLAHEESQQMFLMDHERKIMTAPQWLDYNITTQTYSGIAEEWWQYSNNIGRPITHMIVERNAAQRFMLQSDYIRKWSQSRDVLIVSHDTSSNKSDEAYGVQSLAPVWMHGRVRLPWKDATAQHASSSIIKEVTRWPKGATDDTVMAQWFVHYQWPRLAPGQAKIYQFKRPSWVAS